MPLRRGTPLSFTPTGCSDAVDGTTSFPGAMRALTNFIPDPSTRGLWAARPASLLKTNTFPDANGVPSGLLVVGNLAYGMVPSATFPGKDVPFLFNLESEVFSAIPGIAIAGSNLPLTQPSSGDWTPPVLAQIGNRVIVTHPGFPGGFIKFGWFDLSGIYLQLVGNTTTNLDASRFITGFYSVLGVQPGLRLSGPNIPVGTTVVQTFENSLVGFRTTVTTTAGSATITVGELTGFRVGSVLYGDGIQQGSTVFSVTGPTGAGNLTMSAPALQTITGDIVAVLPTSRAPLVTTVAANPTATWVADGGGSTAEYFAFGQLIENANIAAGTKIIGVTPGTITLSPPPAGSGTAFPNVSGTVILMSQGALGSAVDEIVTVVGGTTTAPLWGAGDTDRAPLPSIPVGVAGFNGRAYYACGPNGVAFSDALQPCRRTSQAQALTTNDGFDVTAVAPLMLNAPITGGIVQALIAFEGANQMRQITGDPATSNLAMNLLPVATGTLAPLSIVPNEKGLAFISPDGLRFIDFAGNVSIPVGDFGAGVVVPFHEAISPSRICGAASSSVLRFTVQNGAVDGDPFQEWWYDLSLQRWHGPHTFPAALIQRWGNQNLVVGVGLPGQLWSSTSVPTSSDIYIENGVFLTCTAETVLLPDTGLMAMNAMIQATLACAGARQINYQVYDEDDQPLDYVGVPITDVGFFRQRPIYFHQPIVFKQMKVVVVAQADQTLRLGNFYWRYQILGTTVLADLPAPGAFL